MNDLAADRRERAEPVPAVALGRPARWPRWLALYLLCFAGGSVGWFLTRPLYRSEGTIRVMPLARQSEELRPPLDQMAVDAELVMARSSRVRDLAMRGPDWMKTGLGVSPAVERLVEKSLDVTAVPGGVLRVWFHHPDPKVAQAGAHAITMAYYNLRMNQNQTEAMRRVRLLDERRSLLGTEIARLDQQLLEAATVWGSTDLSVIHTYKLQESLRLERAVQDAAMPPADAPPSAATRPVPKLLVDRAREMRQEAVEVGRHQLKLQDLVRRRDGALREQSEVRERINRVMFESALPSGLQVVSSGDLPGTPAIDRRWRSAAWGALAGLVVFALGRGLFRMWRERRRVVNARTAFPLVTHYTPARAVVPVEDSNGEEKTCGLSPSSDTGVVEVR
jgi:hypothetical protein